MYQNNHICRLKYSFIIPGVQVFTFAAVQGQCSDALKNQVDPIVQQLLGGLQSVNGISNACDDSVKAAINCE